MTNIDPATGLPQLPEGYFWRVRKDTFFRQYSYIEIRKPGRLFGSKIVVQATRHTEDIDEQEIRTFADMLSEELEEKLNPKPRTEKNLFGDYPPKKLGA